MSPFVVQASRLSALRVGIATFAALAVWCGGATHAQIANDAHTPSEKPIPISVKLVDLGAGKYRLERAGQPYFVKGAGGSGSPALLAECGGNSIRTWGVDKLDAILDEAEKLKLTVAVGIWLGHERHGFNYNDADQVAAQYDEVKKTIEHYKNHPAVLLWGLGNEMEGYEKGDNAAIWSAINNLAVMAKHVDPNHPTMTVVAEIGGQRVKNIHRLCPDIDLVGINSYGGVADLPAQRYKAAGGTKPYLITEYGPPGSWETKKTAWNVATELTSTEKAARYRLAYEKAILADEHCLGGYAFVWGHKQEATATWFGMLLPGNKRLGAVDVMTEMWSDKPPANRCPLVEKLSLKGADQVEPGATLEFELAASDPEGDAIAVEWIVQGEPSSYSVGGDAEESAPKYPEAIVKSDAKHVTVKAPSGGGGYRLFAYLTDKQGNAATANLPFLVKGPVVIPKAKPAALPLVLYDEADAKTLPFAPAGFMGNAKGVKLDPNCDEKPHAGKTCMKAEYRDGDGWAGVVWQSPAGDWGDRPGGWDLTGAKRLSFWVRGAQGGETVSFSFGLLGADKKFADSAKGSLEKVKLTGEWQRLTIDLAGKDLSRIKTGFAWVVTGGGKPLTFYLDDIRFEGGD